MTSPAPEVGYCEDCERLRKAYLRAAREVDHWQEHQRPESDSDVCHQLRTAEENRLAAREAWLNHQTTVHAI